MRGACRDLHVDVVAVGQRRFPPFAVLGPRGDDEEGWVVPKLALALFLGQVREAALVEHQLARRRRLLSLAEVEREADAEAPRVGPGRSVDRRLDDGGPRARVAGTLDAHRVRHL